MSARVCDGYTAEAIRVTRRRSPASSKETEHLCYQLLWRARHVRLQLYVRLRLCFRSRTSWLTASLLKRHGALTSVSKFWLVRPGPGPRMLNRLDGILATEGTTLLANG